MVCDGSAQREQTVTLMLWGQVPELCLLLGRGTEGLPSPTAGVQGSSQPIITHLTWEKGLGGCSLFQPPAAMTASRKPDRACNALFSLLNEAAHGLCASLRRHPSCPAASRRPKRAGRERRL